MTSLTNGTDNCCTDKESIAREHASLLASAARHRRVQGISGHCAPSNAKRCRTRLRAQQNDGFDPRFGWFGLELGFVLADAAKQAIRGKTIVGDLVIAGTDTDALKIRQSQSYVLRRIYWQGVMLGSVAGRRRGARRSVSGRGYEQYLSLYSPRFHRESGPVVARLDECRPTRLREEIAEAAVLGIPGLFWVFVSAQLLEYGDRRGVCDNVINLQQQI